MNFARLFKDYNVAYSTKVNRGWVNSNCPYCDTKSDSFNMGFNPYGDYCTCWKCGGHNLKEVLSLLTLIPKSQLDGILEDYKGRTQLVNDLNRKECRATKLTLPTDTFTSVERKYLVKRGFNPDELHDKYRICGGGIVGKWKFRIVLPLIYNNRIVSWTARSILSKSELKELDLPRYKNLSIEDSVMNPKECLYNIDNCNRDSVILTEGAFDVLRFGDNALCSLGTTVTEKQLGLIAGRFKTVYILFDNEPEAQAKARYYGYKLSELGVRKVEVVDAYSDYNKNDAGDLTYDEACEIKRELNLM